MDQVPKPRRWGIHAGILAAVLIGVLTIAAWVIVDQEPFKHEAVSFKVLQSCASEAAKAPRGKKFSSEWDRDALVVRATKCANCGATIEKVSAQVMGNVVLMRISAPKPPIPTACNCAHSATVRLSSLPKRDYAIYDVDSLIPGPTFCE